MTGPGPRLDLAVGYLHARADPAEATAKAKVKDNRTMDDEKNTDTDTEQTDENVAEPADTGPKALWREGLVQEALSSRPELRQLATKKDFAASRKIGHDLGFEDGARKLTLEQLQAIESLKNRRLANYARHEMPGDLRGYLDERSVGLEDSGFLAGYVDGVGDFLQAYKEQLRRQG
jgi:hypothetical protein